MEEINFEEISYLLSLLNKERAKQYQTWLEVALCLHNISSCNTMKNLFINFSSQEEEKCEKTDFDRFWSRMEKRRDGGLSIGTLKYWARVDSPKAYKEYIRSYMERSLLDTYFTSDGNNHHDIAQVCLSIWKGLYVSTNLDKQGSVGSWYYFSNHRWRKMPGGDKLYTAFSTVLNKHYDQKIKDFKKKFVDYL